MRAHEQTTGGKHAKTDHAGKDVYGIVNLEGGEFGFIGDINGRGQAAFEYFGLDGALHVGFFNGERVTDISPPNNGTSLLGDLNDKGEVGFAASVAEPAYPGGGPFRPFRWSTPRGLAPLAYLTHWRPARATACSDWVAREGFP